MPAREMFRVPNRLSYWRFTIQRTESSRSGAISVLVLETGGKMTSLRHIPARTASVDTAAQTSRVEQQTLTESILVRFAGCHDVDECCGLRQQAVLLNLFLADGIAARYAGRGVDWDDLVQVARLGLLKAVVGYRAGKGAGFAA